MLEYRYIIPYYYFDIVKLRCRSGPRSKDKDLYLGYTLNLVCHHLPPTTHSPPLKFSWAGDDYKPQLFDIKDDIYDMGFQGT